MPSPPVSPRMRAKQEAFARRAQQLRLDHSIATGSPLVTAADARRRNDVRGLERYYKTHRKRVDETHRDFMRKHERYRAVMRRCCRVEWRWAPDGPAGDRTVVVTPLGHAAVAWQAHVRFMLDVCEVDAVMRRGLTWTALANAACHSDFDDFLTTVCATWWSSARGKAEAQRLFACLYMTHPDAVAPIVRAAFVGWRPHLAHRTVPERCPYHGTAPHCLCGDDSAAGH